MQATYEASLLMAEGRRLESSRSEAAIRAELDEAAGVALHGLDLPRPVREALTSVH